ncbi:MAG: hypothetical protein AAGE76_09800 [Pseudomonadota bacterium]
MTKLAAMTSALIFGLTAGGAWAQQPAAQMQQMIPAQVASQAISPAGGGFLNPVPPLTLKCLQWHCQGAEWICLRFTTAQ